MWGLLRWRKDGRGRFLRVWLAWAHGTFCACQMTKGGGSIEYLYFPFNFPTIVWILCCQVALGLCLGHLCQSQRDSSWPDMATYWRRNRFQENSELSFLEIFPWLSEPGLDTQTIWGTLDPNTPVSVSCIFSFHKLKNIFVHLRCVFIDFTHFEQCFASAVGLTAKQGKSQRPWRWQLLFSGPWWFSVSHRHTLYNHLPFVSQRPRSSVVRWCRSRASRPPS